jgi:hypothetical protein
MATVITNVGEELACDLLRGAGTVPSWVAWGTGATAAAKAQTTLTTEGSEARVNGTTSTNGTGASATFRVVATITADGTKTISECGLFTAVTSGTMYLRSDFTGIAVNSGDSIEFTIDTDPS